MFYSLFFKRKDPAHRVFSEGPYAGPGHPPNSAGPPVLYNEVNEVSVKILTVKACFEGLGKRCHHKSTSKFQYSKTPL